MYQTYIYIITNTTTFQYRMQYFHFKKEARGSGKLTDLTKAIAGKLVGLRDSSSS